MMDEVFNENFLPLINFKCKNCLNDRKNYLSIHPYSGSSFFCSIIISRCAQQCMCLIGMKICRTHAHAMHAPEELRLREVKSEKYMLPYIFMVASGQQKQQQQQQHEAADSCMLFQSRGHEKCLSRVQ